MEAFVMYSSHNRTGDKDGYDYFYDYENRVVKIEKSDGSGSWETVAEMAYDASGRRIRVQKDYSGGSPTSTTLYYYNR